MRFGCDMDPTTFKEPFMLLFSEERSGVACCLGFLYPFTAIMRVEKHIVLHPRGAEQPAGMFSCHCHCHEDRQALIDSVPSQTAVHALPA